MRTYIGVFVFLTVVTLVEMLPLFGIWDIPGVVLLGMSAVKFVVVCYFFMHLLGDNPVFQRLFFIPLVMVILTVMVLMSLFKSWHLNYRVGHGGEDSDEVASRYRSVWKEDCNAWAKSPFTGNVYCASPGIPLANLAVYEELKKPAAADPRLADLASKAPADQEAALMLVGGEVYAAQCAACHQATGLGLAGVFPPLAGDPLANAADPSEHVSTVLKGLAGKTIGGVAYPGAMPAFPQLSDEQIAAVVTYERKSWGNAGTVVMPEQVLALR